MSLKTKKLSLSAREYRVMAELGSSGIWLKRSPSLFRHSILDLENLPPQVRRSLRAILSQLGTPARVYQVRGKSSGRLLEAIVPKAERYTVLRKQSKSVQQT